MIEAIKQSFVQQFGTEPLMVRSPGRINLIGEHTDYNNGFVLPAAIDKAIYFAAALRDDEQIQLYAYDLQEHYTGSIRELVKSTQGWPDYILGCLDQLQKRGIAIRGFNGVLGGDVPLGAGLSSSAAVECAVLFALNELLKAGLERIDIVKTAQKVENEFIGLQSGIMDQFASAFGKKDKVIRLDCRSLAFEHFSIDLQGCRIVLFDSNVKHSLASSEYNLRRQECEAGVALIQQKYPEVKSLRDATIEMVESEVAPVDPNAYRRCRFIVGEIARLQAACADLDNNDLAAFGRKMYTTHDGLSKDYEVSCIELDFLVDYVRDNEAVIGARMMGGGFGGCTINLIKKDAIEGLVPQLSEAYTKATGLHLKHYIVSIEDGTGIING